MATGTRTTYSDTTPQKRAVADLIQTIDWTEAPLLRLLGVNNESKFRIVNMAQNKVEWLEDSMSPRSGTLGAAIEATDATTATLGTGEAAYLKEGDVIKIDNELIWVGASNGTTGLSSLARGFGGSTAATHLISTAWTLVTGARLEGADYDTGHTTSTSAPYNYSQILAEAVSVSGSEAENSKYGIDDTMAYHLAKLMADGGKAGKLPILLEQTFYYGLRSANGGSTTTARAMGGFNQFVTSTITDAYHVVNKSTAALTRADIEGVMQACFDAGGKPDTLITGSWGLRKISSFYEGLVRTERSEERGGSIIRTIVTDFGDIEVVHDRWCPAGELYVIEKDKMGWVQYGSRGFSIYDRPSMGDYSVKEILGEYTFVLCNADAHGRIYGFSTTK